LRQPRAQPADGSLARELFDHVHRATDRAALKEAYRRASRATRGGTLTEIEALDHLVGEGLD